jgi:hypothetical protein
MIRRLRYRLKKIYLMTVYYRQCRYSRKEALEHIRTIVKEKGVQLVDKKMKSRIREYCRKTFGSAAYWPWLALYTEIRGEFKEGWIPADYFRFTMLKKINPPEVAYISMNKTLDYRLFGDLCVKPLLIIKDKLIYDAGFQVISKEAANEILKSHNGEVVIKEDDGRGGKEVRFIEASRVSLDDLTGKGGLIIQSFIQQHPVLAEIYPVSTNTLRVVTLMDRLGKIHVKFVALKFGANGTRVDNASMGGRFVYLNDKGEVISDAYIRRGLKTEKEHPDTGKVYRGLVLPSIDKVYKNCIRAHQMYPYVALIGWDVIIDVTGTPFFVEWNALFPAFWYNEALVGPLIDPGDLKKMPGS